MRYRKCLAPECGSKSRGTCCDAHWEALPRFLRRAALLLRDRPGPALQMVRVRIRLFFATADDDISAAEEDLLTLAQSHLPGINPESCRGLTTRQLVESFDRGLKRSVRDAEKDDFAKNEWERT